MSPVNSPRAVRGFTLIELLTVIAIIGILAAILIPTVAKVRDSAHQATTVSNLRQLMIANRVHASDHRGLFVPPEAESLPGNGTNPAQWYNNPIFVGYLGNSTINGGERTDATRIIQSGKPGANNGVGVSIGISPGRNSWPLRISFREAEVDKYHPNMIMFADARNWVIAGSNTRDDAPERWDDSEAWSGWGQVAFRHSGRANAVLANGAVIRLSKSEMVGSNELLDRYFPDASENPWTASILKRNPPPY
jgi:prepilin-type N-terminal cleavage/methylation domain-containing protein